MTDFRARGPDFYQKEQTARNCCKLPEIGDESNQKTRLLKVLQSVYVAVVEFVALKADK